jgi:hypothetical protein
LTGAEASVVSLFHRILFEVDDVAFADKYELATDLEQAFAAEK